MVSLVVGIVTLKVELILCVAALCWAVVAYGEELSSMNADKLSDHSINAASIYR